MAKANNLQADTRCEKSINRLAINLAKMPLSAVHRLFPEPKNVNVFNDK